jgi:hypothetical protein
MLVYGDVDVVFVTTLKRVPPSPADEPNLESGTPHHHHQHRQHHHIDSPGTGTGTGTSNKRISTHAFIPPGKVNSSEASPSHAKALNSHMTVTQFLAAVQELAVRLYSKVIELKTGTVLECLPTQQRERAIRAALDVLMLKKIVPMANQLGLIPWELMVLDQCLTTIHSSPVVGTCLVNHIHIFLSWFAHYSRPIPLHQQTNSGYASTPPHTLHAMGTGEEKGWNSKSRDLMRSPASHQTSPLHGTSFQSPAQHSSYSYSSPNHHKHLTPTGGGGGGGGYGAAYASSSSPRPPPSAHTPVFKGITYKEISKFFHDYGIVPYLLKEPQLYK